MNRTDEPFGSDIRPRIRWGAALLVMLLAVALLTQLVKIDKSVMVSVGYTDQRVVQVAALELSSARVDDWIQLVSARGRTQARVTFTERIPDTEATVITLTVDDPAQAPHQHDPARVTFQPQPIWQVLTKWR
jgi:hypothetical protein